MAIARALHVLAIVHWIGGVAMVTNDSGRRSAIHQLAFESDEPLDDVDEVVQDALL